MALGREASLLLKSVEGKGTRPHEKTVTVPEKGTSGRPRRRDELWPATANPAGRWESWVETLFG